MNRSSISFLNRLKSHCTIFLPLFAGKIHALLCRGWKSRVKGRDFYDYLWYLSHRHRVNLNHLEQRMRQSGHWQGEHNLTLTTLQDLLTQAF